MKNQTMTNPSLPPATQRNAVRDTATLDLFARWRQEDECASPEQVQAAAEDFREFKRAMNQARSSAGEPLMYP